MLEFSDFCKGLSSYKESDLNLKITINNDSNSPLQIYSLDGSNKFRIYFERGTRGENKSPWVLINTGSVKSLVWILTTYDPIVSMIEEHRSFYVVLEVDTETMKQMYKITVTLDK